MCGIVGFVNCGSQAELMAAVETIDHRGPDASGVEWFNESGSGLGHTRLSILDLSNKSSQPMFDPVSGNWIVFNGEIYNFKELRETLKAKGHQFNSNGDTEVVIHAYNEWQEGCLKKFNGMFAFAIFNPSTGDLFAARDRLGIKPFYYYHKDGQLAFASEIKAILELKSYDKKPDYHALYTPVHFQISPLTGFESILKLPAGHFLKFSSSQGLSIHQFWDINVQENFFSEEDAIAQLDELINNAVKLNLVSDVPIGALLSGGLDSSIICAMMQQKMDQPINSFTIKFKEKDLKRQGNVDDSVYAKRLATEKGFNHQEIIIEPNISELLPKLVYHLDEPIADPASINTYLISKAAKEHGISVLLSGMGADEVFGGYRSYLACMKADTYQQFVPKYLHSIIAKTITHFPESSSKKNFKYIRWLKRFLEVASLNQFERQLIIKNSALHSENFNEYFVNANPFESSHYYQHQKKLFEEVDVSYLTKMCYVDTMTYMTDHNLTYSDKSMMAASVEGRPTLIDYRIVEFMFKLKPEMRIKGNTQKYLLKKVAEKYLPKEIIYRPKAPFSAPMRGWLKNELREMVNDLLSESSLKRRGIYNPDFVKKLIANNEKGIEDNSQLIWRLMVNETWFQTYFD